MFDLAAELAADPLARGYAGMTDEQVQTDLDTAYRSRPREVMTSSEVVNAVNVPEYNALNNANKDRFWQLMGLGNLNPFGVEATIMTDIFGGGSTTISSLATLRQEPITRWEELGTDRVPTVPEIGDAR